MKRSPDRDRCEYVIRTTNRECGSRPAVGYAVPDIEDESSVIVLCADHLIEPLAGYHVHTYPPGQ